MDKRAPADCGYRAECPWRCSECPHSSYEDDASGAPGYMLPPITPRAMLKPRVECPMCAARDRERAKLGKGPLPQKFRVRARDSAIYCYYHRQAAYKMPIDSVIRYDPRYHWRREAA